MQLVEWREIVGNCEPSCGGELEETVAEIGAVRVGIEKSVTGDNVDVPLRIGGGCRAAHPERSLPGVRAAVENGGPVEVLGVIADDPPMIGPRVAVRCPSRINDVIQQEKSGTILVQIWMKRNACGGESVARARYKCVDDHRTARTFATGPDIECMQPV